MLGHCDLVRGPDRENPMTPKHKRRYVRATWVCKKCGKEGHSFIKLLKRPEGDLVITPVEDKIAYWERNIDFLNKKTQCSM